MRHPFSIGHGRRESPVARAHEWGPFAVLPSTRSWVEAHALAVATTAAALLALGAALPAVWWEPLHVDEQVTLAVSPHSLGTIVDEVFVGKGGAPAFFFVEHGALEWPGGLEGLRLPPLLFFLASLPALALLAHTLFGTGVAAAAVLTLSIAPLAVGLATFGRMYGLFLAGVLWSTWFLVRAAQSGRPAFWTLAGAACGLLVYVHPIAPLSIVLAFATALAVAGAPFRRVARAVVPGALAAVAVGLPYYFHALGRLRDRYYVGYESSERLDAGADRSVLEESFLAVGGDRLAAAAVLALLALVGLVWLARRRRGLAAALALWVVVPVAFFSLVPAGSEEEGTRFFDRYLLPSLPALALLVAVGCLAIARRAPRPAIAAALLVALVLAVEAHVDFLRLERLRTHDLRALVAALEPAASNGILFSATGAPSSGRTPELLDEYLALEVAGLRRADERSVPLLRAFVESRTSGVGLWVFHGPQARIDRARARLQAHPDLRAQPVGAGLLLVRSVGPAPASALVSQAARARLAWIEHGKRDPVALRLLAVDRAALSYDP